MATNLFRAIFTGCRKYIEAVDDLFHLGWQRRPDIEIAIEPKLWCGPQPGEPSKIPWSSNSQDGIGLFTTKSRQSASCCSLLTGIIG